MFYKNFLQPIVIFCRSKYKVSNVKLISLITTKILRNYIKDY